MTLEAWITFAGFAGLIIFHAAVVWRMETRAANSRALLQSQLEMLREATALSKYGAREEAEALIDEAVRLGEKERA